MGKKALWLAIIGLAAGSGLAFACVQIAPVAWAWVGPRQLLAVDPVISRFERAVPGETITAKFKIANRSDSPVQLLGVQTCCGCTTSLTEYPIQLAPAEQTLIALQVTVGTPDAHGQFKKSARLYVDRPGSYASMTVVVDVVASNIVIPTKD